MWTHRRRALVLLLSVGLVLGIGGGATYAAFSSTTSNGGNSFGVAADYQPPTISRAVIAKILPSTLYLDSAVRQGQTLYVYANVADNGNPAAGISTVTANITNVSAAGSVTLTTAPCPCTVMGSSYNYRSASQTSRNPLSGTQTWSVTATDTGGFSTTTNISGAGPVYSVDLDTTALAPIVATTTATNGGATLSRIESGDVMTMTFNDRVDPDSIKAGWNGAGTIAATVTVTNAANNDTVKVNVTGGTAAVFGTWSLAANYVTGTSSPTATISMSANFTQVFVTLTANPANQVTAAATTPIWARTTTISDDAGNTMVAGNTTLTTTTYF
jgi:hypothetical protein